MKKSPALSRTQKHRNHWRTPRYATGRYPVPQVGSGPRRYPITIGEVKVPDGQAIIDLELKTFTEINPDLSLELRSEQLKLTCALLVEIDLTERPSYNHNVGIRMGYEAEIVEIQHLYLQGKKNEAAGKLPSELVQKMSLLGPAEKIRHDLDAWRESSVTTLLIAGDASIARQAAEIVLG